MPAKTVKNPKVDAFLARSETWQKEMEKLRKILLGFPLVEELKWGVPCYTFQDTNVVLFHAFKDYCAVLFFKGALLKDPEGILVQQTKSIQAARQMRFTNVREITTLEPVLKAYVSAAIEVDKAGLKVAYKKTDDFSIPHELQQKFARMPALKSAFKALTPGRQRAYLLYFAAAKQAKTRESRIEKYIDHILGGKGMDD
jgi:uncharacterized protein YdeI (YjbR/CyaY-like superfamily)